MVSGRESERKLKKLNISKKKLNVFRNKKLSVAEKDQRPLFTLKVAQCAPTLLNCQSAFAFS